MYAFMCVCTYVCVYVWVKTGFTLEDHTHAVCVYVFMYVRMCVCICYACVYVCMYVCAYICMRGNGLHFQGPHAHCTYVRTYVYMYVRQTNLKCMYKGTYYSIHVRVREIAQMHLTSTMKYAHIIRELHDTFHTHTHTYRHTHTHAHTYRSINAGAIARRHSTSTVKHAEMVFWSPPQQLRDKAPQSEHHRITYMHVFWYLCLRVCVCVCVMFVLGFVFVWCSCWCLCLWDVFVGVVVFAYIRVCNPKRIYIYIHTHTYIQAHVHTDTWTKKFLNWKPQHNQSTIHMDAKPNLMCYLHTYEKHTRSLKEFFTSKSFHVPYVRTHRSTYMHDSLAESLTEFLNFQKFSYGLRACTWLHICMMVLGKASRSF